MKTSHLHCSYQLPRILAIVLLASALPLASLSAQQTYTWDNGASNNLWGTTNNWVGDPALTFNNQTDLIFNTNSVVNLANAVSIGGARTIRSLTFGANFVGSTTATFDIRSYSAIGSGAVNLTFAAASGNASINVAQSTSGAAQIRLGAAAGGTQDQGSIVLSTNLDLAQNNTFFNATGFQFDGKITGAGAINKTGLGEVRLIRDNSGWSGGMNINEGNVTIFNSPSAMGTGTWTLGGGASNTSLRVGSANTYSNAGGIVVAAGAGTRTIANYTNTNAAGNSTLSGAITLNKDAIFDITQVTAGTHDRLSLSGAVGGTGGIVKTGTGLLILSNATNSFGGLQINAGQVTLQTNATVTGLSGSGGSLALAGGTLTVNAAASSSYGQVISGAGALTKSGGGTMTLGGTNTYGGATTVSAGSLIVNGNQSGATGLLTVAANATLGGSGTIGGATTISGTHSPGNSPGIQTFTNGLTYNGGAQFIWELAANTVNPDDRGESFDGVNITGGNLSFGGPVTMTLNFSTGVTWSNNLWSTDYLGTSGWLVYSLTGGGNITNFTNLSLANIDWIDSQSNVLSTARSGASFSLYQDGNDIYLNYTAVPEPSTYALLVLSAAGLAAHVVRRRRRRS